MDFEAAKQALRDTPAYRTACQTEEVMNDWPASMVARNEAIAENVKTRNAYRRLDWLIKGALGVRFDFHAKVMPLHYITALDDFIRHLEATQPTMLDVSLDNMMQLGPRVALAKEILKISEAECLHYGEPVMIGSRWFEQLVVQCGYTLDEIVYQNPFKFLYHSPGGYAGDSTGHRLDDFHIKMKHFWL